MASIEAAMKHNPDILILDIAMPKCSGIQEAQELRRRGTTSKIIFLTVQEDADYVWAASEIGASYVLKPRMIVDLPIAIEGNVKWRKICVSLLHPCICNVARVNLR